MAGGTGHALRSSEVGSGEIDFIYSNPAAYTCMAVEFGVQTVASLINFRKGNALGKFAGVTQLIRHGTGVHSAVWVLWLYGL